MGLKETKTVGVIGGLGPEATLDFYAKVIALTPAKRDQEHLHLIIDSNPQVPNRNEAVAGTGPSPGPLLAHMAVGLERAGADTTGTTDEGEVEFALDLPSEGLGERLRSAMKSVATAIWARRP